MAASISHLQGLLRWRHAARVDGVTTELDRRLCRFATIADPRERAYVTRTASDLLMLAIRCGYPDGSDRDWLRLEPAFKLQCRRMPETGLKVHRFELTTFGPSIRRIQGASGIGQ